jgi:hypothetical protein
MAFPPLTTLTGPYGTFQIPGQAAPAFGMPEPDPTIPGPLPTFQPGEFDASGPSAVPGVAGTEPLPPIGLPPALPGGPAPLPAPMPPGLPPSVQPAPAPQPFVAPDEQVNIRSIPTLVLFKGGAERARLSGAVPAAQLTAWIRQHVPGGAV